MEDDSSSNDERFQGVAFAVVDTGDDDFDLDIPPTTGNEYLRRVRQEAKGCPKVVVADIDPSLFHHKQTVRIKQWSGCHPAPRGFSPPLSWQKMQVSNFAELRQKLAHHKALMKKNGIPENSKLPQSTDVEGWCRLCFGRLKSPQRAGLKSDEMPVVEEEMTTESLEPASIQAKSFDGTLPLLNIIASMDQATVVKVLEYHLNWFEATGFTDKQGYWFYALLASLQKPLHPDACALLRSLARACASLRATLENSEDLRLVPLNLFIALIGRYFEQTDLADQVT